MAFFFCTCCSNIEVRIKICISPQAQPPQSQTIRPIQRNRGQSYIYLWLFDLHASGGGVRRLIEQSFEHRSPIKHAAHRGRNIPANYSAVHSRINRRVYRGSVARFRQRHRICRLIRLTISWESRGERRIRCFLKFQISPAAC
jgi:hypothetical protein